MPRPADECPYPKPFSPDFSDCPAFEPRQFIPLDTQYQPLQPVLTCRHLETRRQLQRHRWYAACSLGDAAARVQWAHDVGVDRLAKIRPLQRQLAQAIGPYTQLLWQMKGRQLLAVRDGDDAEFATEELRRLANRAMEELSKFMKENADAFAEVGMPVEPTIDVVRVMFERFIETRYATEVGFDLSDDVLRRFPEPIRLFFRPTVPAKS